MRTTSGTLRFTALQAAMMPSAMVSYFMMPPEDVDQMPLTSGFLSMILKASVTFSAIAAARQEVGQLAERLMVSMVAMARPAPLTRRRCCRPG
jgi:hypothetical protein